MNVPGWMSVVLGLWIGSSGVVLGQVSEIEKKQFEQVRSQAERGDAQAQLNLGTLYTTGRGVKRDLVKGAKWHRKAAEQGLASAQVRVAYEYANGVGVKEDHLEAARWLQRAADQGLAEAQLQLGICYARGDGVTEDAVEAAKLYRKAADQNLAEAQNALGTCYFEGNGVTKDIPEALNLTRKAAEQGLGAAQNTLGMCYTKGKGVPQDYVQAYKWLNLAAAQGSESNVEAKMNLSITERAMTPEQVSTAQKLAREFKPETGSRKTADGNASPSLQSKSGFLNVKADDDTYEVYADGAFVGNAPAKLKLSSGLHSIEVKKAGFKDFQRQIMISEGSELTLRANLEGR